MKSKAKIYILGKGLTQQEVCNALGLGKSYVSQLLDGKCQGNDALNRIAAYLKISRERLDLLIGGKKGVPYAQLRTRGQRHAVSVSRPTGAASQAAPLLGPASTAHHVTRDI